jgi:ferredoxin
MLVIDPETCIDCGVCEVECPAQAIAPDTKEGMDKWVEMNQKYARLWPNITLKKDAPADADAWLDVPDKFDAHFSPKPGKGN